MRFKNDDILIDVTIHMNVDSISFCISWTWPISTSLCIRYHTHRCQSIQLINKGNLFSWKLYSNQIMKIKKRWKFIKLHYTTRFRCNCNMQFHMYVWMNCNIRDRDKQMAKLQLVHSTIAFILIILYWIYISSLSQIQTHINRTHSEYKFCTLTFQTTAQRRRQNQNAQRKLQLHSNAIYQCVVSHNFFYLYWIPICIRAWAKKRETRTFDARLKYSEFIRSRKLYSI